MTTVLLAAIAALILSSPRPGRVRRRLRLDAGRPAQQTAAHELLAALRRTAGRPWRAAPWHDRAGSHAHQLRSTLPDVVDLLRLTVAGGANVHQALRSVRNHVAGDTRDALDVLVVAVDEGSPLIEEVERLRAPLGPTADGLVALLRASLLDGVPLAPALDRLADELRADRRRHAEAAVRRTPIRLLFPLVCCALPALVLLSVVPLLVGTFRSLRL